MWLAAFARATVYDRCVSVPICLMVFAALHMPIGVIPEIDIPAVSVVET
jgi:hypothetical protein